MSPYLESLSRSLNKNEISRFIFSSSFAIFVEYKIRFGRVKSEMKHRLPSYLPYAIFVEFSLIIKFLQ